VFYLAARLGCPRSVAQGFRWGFGQRVAGGSMTTRLKACGLLLVATTAIGCGGTAAGERKELSFC
jgi:hypothetical protein